MNKHIYTFVFIFLFGCSACGNHDPIVNADFLHDLGTENYRIAGKLWLDVYDMDLSTMTYDDYIKYLSEDTMLSAEGLVDKIKLADDKYFAANDSAFTVVLLYKTEQKVVIDNSDSSFVEKVFDFDSIDDLKNLCTYLEDNK